MKNKKIPQELCRSAISAVCPCRKINHDFPHGKRCFDFVEWLRLSKLRMDMLMRHDLYSRQQYRLLAHAGTGDMAPQAAVAAAAESEGFRRRRKKQEGVRRVSWSFVAVNPLVSEGEKIKIRGFNFELTFNGLVCKGNGSSQCSLSCALGIYGLARATIGP